MRSLRFGSSSFEMDHFMPDGSVFTAAEGRIEQEERRNGGQPRGDLLVSLPFLHHLGFMPFSVSPFLLFNSVVGCFEVFRFFFTRDDEDPNFFLRFVDARPTYAIDDAEVVLASRPCPT